MQIATLYLIGLFIYIFPIISFCQNIPNYSQLNIGQLVPDYELTNLINYPSPKANLSDFRGKLLILDFWSTGCTSCIASWPKLEKLQAEFKDKIQIILVNPWQDEFVIKQLIKKRRDAGIVNLTIPIASNDTAILKLFPVKGVPHIVWIGSDGVFKSVTYSDVLNSKNINHFINNNWDFEIHQKESHNPPVMPDTRIPLFTDTAGRKKILWQSTLTKFNKTLPPTMGYYADSLNGYSLFMINCAIVDLYRYAYSDRMDRNNMLSRMPLNRIILEVKNPENYLGQIDGEIQYKDIYSYQLIAGKAVKREELQEMMKADLDRYFALSARIVKKKIPCLILRAKDTSLIAYKKNNMELKITDAEFKVNNVSFDNIIKYLEDNTPYYFSPYPIINETGYSGNVGNIEVEGSIYDYNELSNGLKKYRMSLTLEEREIELLILSNN